MAEKLGWEMAEGTNSHLAGKLQALVLQAMVRAKDETSVKEGSDRFWKHIAGTSYLSGDVKVAAYCSALQTDGAKAMDTLIEMAKRTSLNEEQVRIYSALGVGSDDEDLLQKVLEFGMSKSVRNQDTWNVFASVASGSVAGRGLAWQFFKKEKEEMARRYKTGGLLNNMVKSVTSYFSTLEHADEVENFFAENPFPGAARSITQAAEKIKLRAAWIARDRENVLQYLKAKAYD